MEENRKCCGVGRFDLDVFSGSGDCIDLQWGDAL